MRRGVLALHLPCDAHHVRLRCRLGHDTSARGTFHGRDTARMGRATICMGRDTVCTGRDTIFSGRDSIRNGNRACGAAFSHFSSLNMHHRAAHPRLPGPKGTFVLPDSSSNRITAFRMTLPNSPKGPCRVRHSTTGASVTSQKGTARGFVVSDWYRGFPATPAPKGRVPCHDP